MVEPVAEKREAALRFGADVVIDPNTQSVVTEALTLSGGIGYDAVKPLLFARWRNDESFHGMSEEKITNPVHFRFCACVLHRDLNSRGVNTVIGYLLIAIAELRRANCLAIFNRTSTELRAPAVCFNCHIYSIKKAPRMRGSVSVQSMGDTL